MLAVVVRLSEKMRLLGWRGLLILLYILIIGALEFGAKYVCREEGLSSAKPQTKAIVEHVIWFC